MIQRTSARTNDWHDIFSILAILSVGLVLAGSIAGSLTGSWQLRMYLSIALMLFDSLFILEFLTRSLGLAAFRAHSRPGRLAEAGLLFITSVIPFVLVSGPFIIGWFMADFNLAAVRGYWTSPNPLAALGTVASLRLLRPLRFFVGRGSRGPVLSPGLAGALIVVFCFAFAVDALVLPGYRSMLIDNRTRQQRQLASLSPMDSHRLAGSLPDLAALRQAGQVVYLGQDAHSLPPGDYEYYGDELSGAWFSLQPWHRSRSLMEAFSAALALILPLVLFWLPMCRQDRRYSLQNDYPARDLPVGSEELKGILGEE